MYRQAVDRLLNKVAKTEEFFRAGIVADLLDSAGEVVHINNVLMDREFDSQHVIEILHLGKNEWHETTLIYRLKENSEHDDHRQYSVFMTNRGVDSSVSMATDGK